MENIEGKVNGLEEQFHKGIEKEFWEKFSPKPKAEREDHMEKYEMYPCFKNV